MTAPLARRMRPSCFDNFVGQTQIAAEDSPFRKALAAGSLGSVIFWGPPGCGKTTLAQLIAAHSLRRLAEISAVNDGLPQLRKILATIPPEGLLLFIDEIHRWNKAQQDALLPHLESGHVWLIGATTENPAFSINPALRSRCWIFPLSPLQDNDILAILQQTIQKETLPDFDPKILTTIAEQARGDARRALNILETILSQNLDHKQLQQLLAKDLPFTSKDMRYDCISAWIKSMRGSDPDAALYWMARLLEGGEDPKYLGRRLVIFASEDVGNADLRALPLAVSAMQAVLQIGMPEARIILGQCCSYLASAPKSNAAYKAIDEAISYAKKHGPQPTPEHISQRPRGYLYPHDYPHHYVAQNYWPDDMPAKQFYRPTNMGDEKIISQRLNWWRQKDQES